MIKLNTSKGEIKFSLCTEEAPKACRNFVGRVDSIFVRFHSMLFLELTKKGFYDNHRITKIVKDSLIQIGDIEEGVSIYNGFFEDELSSLSFTEPGCVGMVGGGGTRRRDRNLSSFFITMRGNMNHLDGFYTIFGKIEEDLDLQKLLKFSEVETDKNFHPKEKKNEELPSIYSAQILDDPYAHDDGDIDWSKIDWSQNCRYMVREKKKSGKLSCYSCVIL